MRDYDEILQRYALLLSEVDRWFTRCLSLFPTEISCARGCSDCCRGLFDITLLDAVFLRKGFERLPDPLRKGITERAKCRLEGLRAIWPELAPPYLLNHRPEEEWDALMPDEDETRCVLLGDDGLCLIYDHRPMTCRLHGLPLVDPDGTVLHDEWCTLNFTDADPLIHKELRDEFTRMLKEEVVLFRGLEMILLNKSIKELDTLIPLALLVDYRHYDWSVFCRNYRYLHI